MQADYHRTFRKQYQKLPSKIQSAFDTRLKLFLKNPSHPLLHNHQLTGEYQGCSSINITSDYRAIYFLKDTETCYFIAIGTHSELYD